MLEWKRGWERRHIKREQENFPWQPTHSNQPGLKEWKIPSLKTREAEAGGFLSSKPAWSTEWVPGQPGLHRETLSRKTNKQTKKTKQNTTKRNNIQGWRDGSTVMISAHTQKAKPGLAHACNPSVGWVNWQDLQVVNLTENWELQVLQETLPWRNKV